MSQKEKYARAGNTCRWLCKAYFKDQVREVGVGFICSEYAGLMRKRLIEWKQLIRKIDLVVTDGYIR